MSPTKDDLIFVRHGILSRPEAMAGLAGRLEQIPNTKVDNSNANWKLPVLKSGLRLACEVVKKSGESEPRRIILIGHSQGGLVCRIAAVAICDPRFSANVPVKDTAAELNTWRNECQQHAARVASYLRGVITLATPNAGALTFGQFSIAGRLLLKSTTKVANLLSVRDVADLTTDRLFRILQNFRVPDVKYLSISGSVVSRYSKANHDDLSEIPFLSRLGVHLEKPNDGIVEDCSVDIRQALLPPEIRDLDKQYEHVRTYRDCIDVNHVNIHGNDVVVDIIRSRIAQW